MSDISMSDKIRSSDEKSSFEENLLKENSLKDSSLKDRSIEAAKPQEQIRKECMRKCGMLRARRDYTCARLREKLLGSGYDEETADWALEKLRDAHYIDDARFARSFIAAKRESRSRLRIRKDLEERGVPSDIISEAMREESEESGDEAEIRQIRKLMEKRKFDPGTADWEQKQKMQAYLYRKGYRTNSVRSAMNTDLLDSD